MGSNPTSDTFFFFFFFFRKVLLQNSADVELVLIDDAFIQVCDMINDWSVEVRTEAAKFLVSL